MPCPPPPPPARRRLNGLELQEGKGQAGPAGVGHAEGHEDEADAERLTVIYDRMNEIGASSAEARASKILHGLGFNEGMQKRATQVGGGLVGGIKVGEGLVGCDPGGWGAGGLRPRWVGGWRVAFQAWGAPCGRVGGQGGGSSSGVVLLHDAGSCVQAARFAQLRRALRAPPACRRRCLTASACSQRTFRVQELLPDHISMLCTCSSCDHLALCLLGPPFPLFFLFPPPTCRTSRAAGACASPWPGRSTSSPPCCCWTSQPTTWTSGAGCCCCCLCRRPAPATPQDLAVAG